MSSNLRKCICLSPRGTLSPGSNPDYRNANNRTWFRNSNTKWVRLWFDWFQFETAEGMAKQEQLDDQIKTANIDGVRVVLCFHHRYPRQYSEAPLGSTDDDLDYFPRDRSAGGPWGRVIRFLIDRYKPFSPNNPSGAVIDLLELVNEPNLLLKPSNSASPGKVIEMFRSAQAISADFDHQLAIGGPALADIVTSDIRDYRTFAGEMLREMVDQGFHPHPEFIWTHHNYGDVESDRGSTTYVRDQIAWGQWTGYDEGEGPVVFVTEGGARLDQMAGATRADRLAAQSSRVTSTFNELKGASRVGMQTNYLTYDDVGFPTGLREVDGTARPVYTGWSGLSTGATDLKKWRRGALLPPWTQWDSSLLSQHPGHLEAFAIGSTRRMYNIYSVDNGASWSAWNDLGGECSSGPAAISRADGIMNVFVVGPGGRLYQKWWTVGGGWYAGWEDLGGGITYDPTVSSKNADHLEVFARGNDGSLWHKWWTRANGWTGWHELWGGQIVGSPSAVSWADGRTDVVFKGTDNQLHHMYYNGTWNGPSPMRPLGGIFGHPEIASWKPGHLDIICPGAGNKLHRLTWDGEWSGWSPIPHTGAPQYSPGAVSGSQGRIDVVFQRENRLQHVAWG